MDFKEELLGHLRNANVTIEQFDPVHTVLITWDDTEFTVRKSLLSKSNSVTISF